MPGGYMGKILWVDLSSGKFEEEQIPDEIYRNFIGGYGLGARIIFERQKAKVDPLGEEAIFGMCPGLLTGTGAQFVGRYMCVGKSPLTRGWGDSNSGGYFAPAIKQCGYDGIFFTGKAEKPVYLLIYEGKIELRDASHLWGKTTVETEEIIREELKDEKVQIASIGPAGEKLSFISGIVTDRGRIAARSGLGAVMGSKKLKAVVLKGNVRIPVHDRNALMNETRRFLKRLQIGERFIKWTGGRLLHSAGKLARILPFHFRQEAILWRLILKKFGTSGILSYSVEGGDTPIKNWKGIGYLDFPLSRSSKISDENIIKYEVKKYNCYSCPIACGGIIKKTDGKYKIEESHKTEYETLGALGAMNLIDDPDIIFKMNEMCNEAGIDTISVGSVISFAMECYENGILTKKDLDGIELEWGNGEGAMKLLEKIIKREGIGDVLADGVKVASEKIGKGSEKFAVHAGGQEIPMHDPRYDPGYGIGYYGEPTPGRHTIASFTYLELTQLERKYKQFKKMSALMSKTSWYNPEGKGEAIAFLSKFSQTAFSAGLCLFGLQVGANIPLSEWISAATGWDFSNEEIIVTGQRIATLRQAFNAREGLVPKKDFKLNERATGHPPLEKGPTQNVSLDMEAYIVPYYKEYGWDPQTGIPEDETLKKLGIYELVKGLKK